MKMKKKLTLNKESLRNLTSNEMGQVAGGGDTSVYTSIIIAPHPPIVIPNPISLVAGGCDPTWTLRDRLSPVGIVIGS
jgi:hypothetical protein